MSTPPPLPLNYANRSGELAYDDPNRHIAGFHNHRAVALRERVKQSFPQQAAKASLLTPIIAFALVVSSAFNRGGMPVFGTVFFTVLVATLIFGGLTLGVLALVMNRPRRSPGVTSYAVAGITLNGLIILINIVGLFAVLAG